MDITFFAIGNQNFLGRRKYLILDLKYELSMMNLEGVFFDNGQLGSCQRTVEQRQSQPGETALPRGGPLSFSNIDA